VYFAAKFLALWFDAVAPCFGMTYINEVADVDVTFEVAPGDVEIGDTVTLGLKMTFNMPQPGLDCLSENLAEIGW
jgi:hypothetical protein